MSQLGERARRLRKGLDAEPDGSEESDPALPPRDYGEVGARVASVLEAAERSAAAMREEAAREAEALRGQALAEAAAAQAEAERLRAATEQRWHELRERVERETADLRAQAEKEARQIVASAERKADSVTRTTSRQQRQVEAAIVACEQRLGQLAGALHDVASRIEQVLERPDAAAAEPAEGLLDALAPSGDASAATPAP
jgi:hypothetical protein